MPIEAYVIVSADGMLADSRGVMPDSLKFHADQTFFENALDDADLIVHGRHSHEEQARSNERTRLVMTRSTPALAPDVTRPHTTLWNPDGATFEEACKASGVSPSAKIAIIGGPHVYAFFLDRYDTFWLSQAHDVRLPNGLGVLPGVPEISPQDILAAAGLHAAETRVLDAGQHVDVTAWRR
ncbi:Dihydrofolate reductase OS=Afipia felis OX=1035 GN=NCTC12722_02477 PE=4 SV=1 [Afipia felis]